MSLDIGRAFSEGISRTVAKNGIALVAVFAGIALLTTVLFQSLTVGLMDAFVNAISGATPEELGLSQDEYDMLLEEMEVAAADAREMMPVAQPLTAGIAAAGLLVVALLSEAASIVAVRLFATEETGTIPQEILTRNILLATLNGFVGAIVVWGFIILGLVLFVVPGIFLAIAFYFVRQEIAIQDKNFVQAMADSWRLTKGYRIEVFALALVVFIVSQFELVTGFLEPIVGPTAAVLLTAIASGVLGIFGAAVVTRAYVQLEDERAEAEVEKDPYAAPLGPDDIPK